MALRRQPNLKFNSQRLQIKGMQPSSFPSKRSAFQTKVCTYLFISTDGGKKANLNFLNEISLILDIGTTTVKALIFKKSEEEIVYSSNIYLILIII